MTKLKEDDLVVKNLRLHTLRKLFNMFCIFKREYKENKYSPDVWQRCEACILCDIPWSMKDTEITGSFKRDLCFAIWHERIMGND